MILQWSRTCIIDIFKGESILKIMQFTLDNYMCLYIKARKIREVYMNVKNQRSFNKYRILYLHLVLKF